MPDSGNWSGVFDWPIIGIHAILTSDNKLLTYGTDQYGQQGAQFIYDVWDFATNTHYTLPNPTPTDMFCSAAATIPQTGQILILGGDARPMGDVNHGVHDVNVFDPETMTVQPLSEVMGGGMGGMDDPDFGPMQYERWYPTAITLANGKILTMGGRAGPGEPVGTPELFSASGGWKTLPRATNDSSGVSQLYPRAFLAKNGNVFFFETNAVHGVLRVMVMDPSGDGKLTFAGNLPFQTAGADPAIRYDANKVLILASNGDAWIMDTSGDVPTFKQTASLGTTRLWSNMVVLADGTVMVSGGSDEWNQLIGVHNDVQIWNPQTGQWSDGPDAAVARLYHSTTILLPDATVLSLGGGAPGPLVNTNGEIYKPGYLFNQDGTLAERPVVVDAPDEIAQRQNFTITVDDASEIDRLTLVKYGSVTHSLNMGTSKIELTFIKGPNNTITVYVPPNANILTPGDWMLFAINNKGTPSVAATIKVGIGGEVYADKLGGFLTLNANATANAAGDILTLTQNAQNLMGGAMSNERLDLNHDFKIWFDVSLGNGAGGDGMAFVLHNSRFGADATGGTGGALGAYGIAKGLGIQFDTYNNGAAFGDIAGPHTNFFRTNGVADAAANVSNPTAIDAAPVGPWHNIQVSWDATAKVLSYWVDGALIGSLSGDLAMEYFGGSDDVHFGFTAGTGGKANAHLVRIVGVDGTYEHGMHVATVTPGHAPVSYGTENADHYSGSPQAEAYFGLGGNDEINGGAGNDYIDGGKGNDILNGGDGNDRFVFRIGDGNDTLNGGAGFDTADFKRTAAPLTVSLEQGVAMGADIGVVQLAAIEKVIGGGGNDTIIGNAAADRLEGRGGNDKLNGGFWNDTLVGGWGNDTVTGSFGKDVFLFDTKPNNLTNVDKITDFNVINDSIYLAKSVFANLKGFGQLSQAQFVFGKATEADDHIIYNKANGFLLYDADGSGGAQAVHFATVTPNINLTHWDFFIV